MSTVLLFSVIVPLEDHRDHWERCLRAWQAQTLPKSSFETIFVAPPDFPADACQKLKGLLGPQDRLEYFDANHDIDLLAAGAARAQGRYLFFTESHCWPKPDVLDRCSKTFAAHPDWAGFSGRSTRITHNRLSEVEADMYEGDFEHSLSTTAWRMVLDQCFATQRDRYEACGGFKPEYGHYAEWLLAANYVAHGQKLGFEPAALVYHRYTGRISYVRKFTLDFSAGEIHYFAGRSNEPRDGLLEAHRNGSAEANGIAAWRGPSWGPRYATLSVPEIPGVGGGARPRWRSCAGWCRPRSAAAPHSCRPGYSGC